MAEGLVAEVIEWTMPVQATGAESHSEFILSVFVNRKLAQQERARSESFP